MEKSCICAAAAAAASCRLTCLQNLSCVPDSRGRQCEVSVERVAQDPPCKRQQDVVQRAVSLQRTRSTGTHRRVIQ